MRYDEFPSRNSFTSFFFVFSLYFVWNARFFIDTSFCFYVGLNGSINDTNFIKHGARSKNFLLIAFILRRLIENTQHSTLGLDILTLIQLIQVDMVQIALKQSKNFNFSSFITLCFLKFFILKCQTKKSQNFSN